MVLNATAHAALVLLSFGEASGYELRQRADATLRFFFNAPAMSQIYTELERLTAAGLVADRYETRSGGGERATRVFELTAAGRGELRRWCADDPLPPTMFKSHLALRLMVGYLVEPADVLDQVDTERARVERDLVEVTQVRDALDPEVPEHGWPHLVARWGVRYHADALDQLDELRAGIESLASGGRVT